MNWISVKDKMPKVGVKVKARLKFWNSSTVKEFELIHVNEDDCTWRTADDNSEIAYEWDATHWKPLRKEIDK